MYKIQPLSKESKNRIDPVIIWLAKNHRSISILLLSNLVTVRGLIISRCNNSLKRLYFLINKVKTRQMRQMMPYAAITKYLQNNIITLGSMLNIPNLFFSLRLF